MATGFASGMFRVFDIEKIQIVEEASYHSSPITAIKYSPDNR